MHEHALAPPRSVPKDRTRRRTAPWMVAGVVALVYAALIVPRLGAVNNFAHVGRQYLTQGTTSKVIKPSLGSQSKIGFDGQFYYFIALDPNHARDYVDGPAYRYSRIGYPMLARALSGGNASGSSSARCRSSPLSRVSNSLCNNSKSSFAIASELRSTPRLSSAI